jgi:hypothetical protein
VLSWTDAARSDMKRLIIPCVFVLTCVSLIASQQQSLITGQISDSEGAAIAKARVVIHWDSAGSKVGLTDNIGVLQDVAVTTDANGKYSVTIPAVFYDVFVSATAFTPAAAKVRIKQGQHATHNVSLRVDPLVSSELAN